MLVDGLGGQRAGPRSRKYIKNPPEVQGCFAVCSVNLKYSKEEGMAKNFYEVRDPIHTFIRMDKQERDVVDSRPVQRLRHIHHLAMSYLVYPGACHRRFEHSLGVMELAGRVYDIVTNSENLTDDLRSLFPELTNVDQRNYWRKVLRIAALCHDIGHMPFSHAAEGVLPNGFDHELLTKDLILSAEMKDIWRKDRPTLEEWDIAKLAIGPKKLPDVTFSDWETVLSEIIVGDAFGVDRMDYLLRDSWHAGVAYGRFDHHRLIDTLRILPPPGSSRKNGGSIEPSLGVEEGGIQSAEALLLARYFMYSQVYFHKSRKIYDIHLKDFLVDWLDGGNFKTDTESHLSLTDNEVLTAMRAAAKNPSAAGHVHADRIMNRKHFRRIYEYNSNDFAKNPLAGEKVFEALVSNFGEENVRFYSYNKSGGIHDFPVRLDTGDIVSSMQHSDVLKNIPPFKFFNIYINENHRTTANQFLNNSLEDILNIGEEQEDATT